MPLSFQWLTILLVCGMITSWCAVITLVSLLNYITLPTLQFRCIGMRQATLSIKHQCYFVENLSQGTDLVQPSQSEHMFIPVKKIEQTFSELIYQLTLVMTTETLQSIIPWPLEAILNFRWNWLWKIKETTWIYLSYINYSKQTHHTHIYVLSFRGYISLESNMAYVGHIWFLDICQVWLMANFMMASSNGNIFRVTGPLCGEFTGTQRPVTRSFDVFFDLRLNKRWSKQPWDWWFETPSWSLWRQCNVRVKLLGH